MFSKRSDGVKVKNLDPVTKAAPFFMPTRLGAQNYMDFKTKKTWQHLHLHTPYDCFTCKAVVSSPKIKLFHQPQCDL